MTSEYKIGYLEALEKTLIALTNKPKCKIATEELKKLIRTELMKMESKK